MQKNIISFCSILIISLLLFSISCKLDKNNAKKNNVVDTNKVVVKTKQIPINLEISKKDSTKFIVSDIVEISMKIKEEFLIDSTKLYINNKYIKTFFKNNFIFEWNSSETKVGNNIFQVVVYFEENKQRKESKVFFLSDIVPKQEKYKIVNIFPHDRNAYTQGLLFYNDVLYEATGQKGESTIRKTKLKTGDIIRSYTVTSNIFGEGITIFNDQIIQLSWQARIGYIYDLETFEKINQFQYATEGWGLTNDETHLIMSDGTNIIYFLETQSFTIIDQIEVCDNKGVVVYLNELEYINGILFANIFMTDKIARIDPRTGKVLAYINLENILPEKDKNRDTDVLNGIAYDKNNNRIFVTGKKWPKLFEIKIVN